MKHDINRREFLRRGGAAALAIGGLGALNGCKSKEVVQNESKEASDQLGEMTYRTNPKTGEKVSILGYGCMRWPMIKDKDGKDIIDQEAVNRLIDHALENGINYFDTAPMYLQGQSEEATANALVRHPRESYYLATKLSNFGDFTYEGAMEMYKRSFKRLQTD